MLVGLQCRFIDGYQAALLMIPTWMDAFRADITWKDKFNTFAGTYIREAFGQTVNVFELISKIADNHWYGSPRRAAIDAGLADELHRLLLVTG